MQILDESGRAASIEIAEVKKGERIKKAPASVYHQYPAAGGFQGPEFFHPEDHASGAAAL